MFKLVTTGIGVLVGAQMLLAAPAQADHRRHWFYDHYRTYDGQAFDYRTRARIYRPRESAVEFGYSSRSTRYEDDDYVVEPRRAKKHPWRDRRIRYDLSAKQPGRTYAAPPTPRSKPLNLTRPGQPLSAEPHRDDVEYSALENPGQAKPETPVRRKAKPAPAAAVSCKEAREIVAGFGFSHIQANSCQGKTYSFAAKRDGKPFTIELSSLNGELTQVKRQ